MGCGDSHGYDNWRIYACQWCYCHQFQLGDIYQFMMWSFSKQCILSLETLYHAVISPTSASPNVLLLVNSPTELSTTTPFVSLLMISGSTSLKKSRI